MGQFSNLDYDYSEVSLDAGYRIWRQNEGRRVGIGFGFTCRGRVTPGPHWSGRWVATRGMGNCGVHIIVPVSREARKLVRMHVIECWMNRYGISYRQAEALYRYRGRYKFELVADICAAINDEACHKAMLRFPGVGPGLHHDWMERWGHVVARYCQRSWPRNAALIEAVNHVIRETSREFQSA